MWDHLSPVMDNLSPITVNFTIPTYNVVPTSADQGGYPLTTVNLEWHTRRNHGTAITWTRLHYGHTKPL